MTGGITYEGNDIYGVYLDSGYTLINKADIYELVKEIAKKEILPTLIEDYNFEESWAITSHLIPEYKSKIKNIGEIEEVMEDFLEEVISVNQTIATNYFKQKYIIIDKN